MTTHASRDWLAAVFLAASIVLALFMIWTVTETISPYRDLPPAPRTVTTIATVTATT